MADGSPLLSATVLALGWTLLHFLWQGVLIGAAYAVARRAMAGAAAGFRLALGHLALLACAAAAVATFVLHWPTSSPADADAMVGAPAGAVASLGTAPDAGGWSLEAFLPWLVAAWAAGAILLALRTALQWWTLRQLARSARPLDAPWLDRLAALRQRMGVRVAMSLRESSRVAAPLLVGWLRPTILLPMGLALRLPQEQLEAVLAHELAHVRRFDTWFNALQCALETLLYFHPAVHWIGRRVRADREECCDLAVTASGIDRLDYARALLALGESHREQADHGRLAIAATDGLLLARVERLLLGGHPREAAASANWPMLGLAAALCLLLLTALPRSDERSWAPAAEAMWASPSPARMLPLASLVVADLTLDLTPARPVLPATVEPAAVVVEVEATAPMPIEVATAHAPSPLDVPAVAAPAPLASAPALHQPRLDEVLVEPLRPLHRVAPTYPRAALARGLEGSVVVSFRVDASGRPVDLAVASADSRVFEGAALAALARWRFAPGEAGNRHLQTFDFRLDSVAGESDERDACNAPTGSRICRRAR